MANFDQELDASGLNCPSPSCVPRRRCRACRAGNILRIIATDPGSVKDFEAFARQTGNQLPRVRRRGRQVRLPAEESVIRALGPARFAHV